MSHSTRCIECSKHFTYVSGQGKKLHELTCECGGRLEILYLSGTLFAGINPFDAQDTKESRFITGKYWNVRVNSKKELFYKPRRQNFYYHVNPANHTRAKTIWDIMIKTK